MSIIKTVAGLNLAFALFALVIAALVPYDPEGLNNLRTHMFLCAIALAAISSAISNFSNAK